MACRLGPSRAQLIAAEHAFSEKCLQKNDEKVIMDFISRHNFWRDKVFQYFLSMHSNFYILWKHFMF